MIRASLLALALIAAPAGAQLSGALPGSLTAARMTAAEAIAAIKAAPAGATINLAGVSLGDMGTIRPRPNVTLIGGTFKCLRERLRGFLQPFLWKRTNSSAELLYGVSLGRTQCGVGEEDCELLAVLAKIDIVVCTIQKL